MFNLQVNAKLRHVTILQYFFLLFVCNFVSGNVLKANDIKKSPIDNIDNQNPHVFVTLGASGDLASKEIYPTLWYLFRDGLLPPNIIFYGYARSKISVNDIKQKAERFLEVKPSEQKKYEEFWKLNYYLSGQYNSQSDFQKLNDNIENFEKGPAANRIFYLALPPSVYEDVTVNIKNTCMGKKGWTRIVIEKPFGKDLESSNKLSNHLSQLFTENQMYKMDHFLGKEMVQNLLTLRFGNRIFNPIWNKNNIAGIHLSFLESFGAQGRGGYFDEFGIIRDVIQNHMMQILTLIAMEKPNSFQDEDITNEKVKVLESIPDIQLKDVYLGQYVGNPEGEGDAKMGYLDDSTVPKNSITSTYAMIIMYINNERWNGVPFILECGKALNESRVDVKIQFKDVENIFNDKPKRNELIIHIQPVEALSLKLNIKNPGKAFGVEKSDLNLNYSTKYPNVKIPEAYERLLLDVFSGSHLNFVRSDELREAWRIFTPVLHKIEKDKVKPISYVFGSHGPKEAEDLLKKTFSNELRKRKSNNVKG